MGSRNTGHSSGRKGGLRRNRREGAVGTEAFRSSAAPVAEWKRALLAIRDALIGVRTTAAVIQRSLTAEQGDPNAAAVLLEGVCYPLIDIIGRLEKLNAAVRS